MRIMSNSITAYSNPIAKTQNVSIQNSQKYVPTFCGQYYDTTSITSPKFLQAKAYLDKAKDEKYCKEHTIEKCIICGKDVPKTRIKSKTCSRKCYATAYKRNWRVK